MNCSQELFSRLSRSLRSRSWRSQRAVRCSSSARTDLLRSLCWQPMSRSWSPCFCCVEPVTSSSALIEERLSRRPSRSSSAVWSRCWAADSTFCSSRTEAASSALACLPCSSKAQFVRLRRSTVCPCSSSSPECALASAERDSSSSCREAFSSWSSATAACRAEELSRCSRWTTWQPSSSCALVAKVATACASKSLDSACTARISLLAVQM
mmetsp:Transcript_50528/g.101642  ORF Transcript_50528/g.101642 Transcript_50528/m.101642 type:complete len:211 (-) Transcript_50528:378-1010(-)